MTPLTPKQQEALAVLGGPQTHTMLLGGSRSGKTYLLTRAVFMRAVKAPGSRHAIFRFRFNHAKASLALDTIPKVLQTQFPGLKCELDKTDWYYTLPNGSQVFIAGLDDKIRAEKVLGQEFASVYFNECSQIPLVSRDMAMTRLAQRVKVKAPGVSEAFLKPRAYYDANPPSKLHWTYRLFVEHRDPETRKPLDNPEDYVWFRINPADNQANLSPEYLRQLEGMSPKLRQRFLHGEFADANPNALFNDTTIETWRVTSGRLPDMQRIVIGVDPSGSGDTDNADNDAIGICVVGLGIDGNAYLLEDATVKAGPAVWGRVVADCYDRHAADVVVGEQNYGGAMVQHVIQTAQRSGRKIAYKAVTATRGKVVRAEPFSSLYESGKIRHVGYYPELEDEICAFATNGYTGDLSPNRADALFWALAELFPGMVRQRHADTVIPKDAFDFQALVNGMGY